MARSVAIIGAGQIGYAAARAFQDDWKVSVCARSQPDWLAGWPCDFVPYITGEDPIPEADVVIDTIAFDEADVARYDPDKIGRLITISSASVYCDAEGRTLDEAAQNGFPEFDGPITEDQPTVAPGAETYSTRKVKMEHKAGELFADRATILRPCAIYGPHTRHPRELWFVKRLLDKRAAIPLAHNGSNQFHTTDVETIAYFARHAASNALGGVFNLADDYAPDVHQIGQLIADEMDVNCDFIPFAGEPKGTVGRTPWSVPKPFIVSCGKAFGAQWDGFTTYPGVNNDAIYWLARLHLSDWRTAFPQLAAYPWDLFDYDAEDRFFASL